MLTAAAGTQPAPPASSAAPVPGGTCTRWSQGVERGRHMFTASLGLLPVSQTAQQQPRSQPACLLSACFPLMHGFQTRLHPTVWLQPHSHHMHLETRILTLGLEGVCTSLKDHVRVVGRQWAAGHSLETSGWRTSRPPMPGWPRTTEHCAASEPRGQLPAWHPGSLEGHTQAWEPRSHELQHQTPLHGNSNTGGGLGHLKAAGSSPEQLGFPRVFFSPKQHAIHPHTHTHTHTS